LLEHDVPGFGSAWWYDWQVVRILYREAEGLIVGKKDAPSK